MVQPWMQRNYCLIDNRHIAQERSHFEIILVNIAPQVAMAPIIDEECRSLLVGFSHKGSRLWVLNVHLFSDSGNNAFAKREEYLSRVLAQLPAEETVLLQGDFNFGDEHQSAALAEFTDFWLQLHPAEAGITYDGSNNPMSKKVIPNARDRRLDRMMVRTETGFPLAEDIAVLHVREPETGEYLSDHYALQAKLSFGGSFGSLRRAPKTHHSALTLLPPAEVCAEIQSLRREYDTTFSRWMPHINLLYGFIPQPYFAEASVVLQNALAGIPAFELTLEGFDSFEHGDSTTIWLRPDAAATAKLREIQQIFMALFPNCIEQDRHGVWNPHLTVAKIPGSRKREAKQLLGEWNAIWKPVTFTVDGFAMIARAGNSAFKICEQLALGESESRLSARPNDLRTTMGKLGLLPSAWKARRRQAVIADIEKAASSLRLPTILLPVGSLALDTLLPDSDLDFLCISHLPQVEFFAGMQRNIAGITLARVATNSFVPTLRLEIGDTEADIMYLRLPTQTAISHPSSWTPTEIAQLSPTNLRVFNAHQDLRIVTEMVAEAQESFRLAAIALKAWADAQDLSGNAFGYPGGFAWSLMLAQAGVHSEPEAWIAAFLEQFLENEWSGKAENGDVIPMLLTSGAPGDINITRNVSPRTLETLRTAVESALLQVWAIWDGEATWEDFLAPNEMEHAFAIQLEWQASDITELEHASGWMQSQIIALLRDLEALPFLKARAGGSFQKVAATIRRYEIGLSVMPDEAQMERIYGLLDTFEKAFHEMPNRPESAKLRSKVAVGLEYSQELSEV
jgi:poly(A) polymerase